MTWLQFPGGKGLHNKCKGVLKNNHCKEYVIVFINLKHSTELKLFFSYITKECFVTI